MALKIESWNTGRWYTEAGQRMAACYGPDDHLYFVDADRCVDGRSKEPIPKTIRDSVYLKQVAMDVYDYNKYVGFRWHREYEIIARALIVAANNAPIADPNREVFK